MGHIILPLIGAALFFLEPLFSLFSPLEISGGYYTLVPRFLILYLIFTAVYYDRTRAVAYALFFGLLYDVFFIDIIGLYSFLYPLISLLAGTLLKAGSQRLPVAAALGLGLVVLLEILLYLFFSFISFTSMPFGGFLGYRLMPSILANSVFLVVLAWGFKIFVIPWRSGRNRFGLSR